MHKTIIEITESDDNIICKFDYHFCCNYFSSRACFDNIADLINKLKEDIDIYEKIKRTNKG